MSLRSALRLAVLLGVPVTLAIATPGPRAAAAATPAPRLVVVRQEPAPVLTTRSKGAEDVRYGFEGGRVVKVDGTYHLFTSEMAGDPIWVKMRFGHWTSRDRLAWTRVATVRESSAEFEGKDPRAALWSPLPVFDPGEDRWNLFYVAYRARPTDGTRFLLNHDGAIWRAVSRARGEAGIGGPYDDVGVVMKPGPDSRPWEGLQGTDSFFPWPVGGRWRALYGSAWTQTQPIRHWLVGPAEAATLAGPWRRVAAANPAPIEERFIENPIVTELPGGGFAAVYDSEGADAVGWAYSPDGIAWEKGQRLVVQPKAGLWSKEVRTPLGLVPEGGDRYSLFYTGFEQAPDWARMLGEARGGDARSAVGLVELRLER
jgi:hypothetical protein